MTNQKNVKVTCDFCEGRGVIENFAHVEGGMCFSCRGKGYILKTQEDVNRKAEQDKKFNMVLLPASTNTYNDKEVIKSLGFTFKPAYGWIKVIRVEALEEAEEVSREVGAEAKAKGLHGVFLMDMNKLEGIQSPQHMQQLLRHTIKKELGN